MDNPVGILTVVFLVAVVFICMVALIGCFGRMRPLVFARRVLKKSSIQRIAEKIRDNLATVFRGDDTILLALFHLFQIFDQG